MSKLCRQFAVAIALVSVAGLLPVAAHAQGVTGVAQSAQEATARVIRCGPPGKRLRCLLTSEPAATTPTASRVIRCGPPARRMRCLLRSDSTSRLSDVDRQEEERRPHLGPPGKFLGYRR